MRKLTTIILVKTAIVAALYTIMSLMVAPFSYGIVQFRVSEVLNLLAFIDPFYIVGVTLGCFITNLFSPFGLADVVFGTFATLCATFCIYKSKNLIIASLFPTIFCFIIGIELALFAGEAFLVTTAYIMLSEFIICSLIAVPIFKIIFKNKNFLEILRIDKDNNAVYEKSLIPKFKSQ